MKTIIITGPSGSGKTYLSNKLSKLFDNSIVIRTDSYYRDDILIRFLSIFLYDIHDRLFSIKKKELMKTLKSINNKDKSIKFYKYDFKSKHSSHSKKSINYNRENQLLILEGIFAHRLNLNYQETINILCVEKKEICLRRRLKRDQLERNRNSREVNKKFNRSWYLFYMNIKNILKRNKIINVKAKDKKSYDKLIINLNNIKKQ